MSAGARWLLAIAMFAMAAGFAWAGASGLVPSSGALYVLAVVCVLIAVAGVSKTVGPIAGRILGAGAFALCVAYLISQLHTPGTADITSYRRSQPNLPNAIIALVVFGIPGLIYAITGRWTGRIKL
jgi:hypothetical protein